MQQPTSIPNAEHSRRRRLDRLLSGELRTLIRPAAAMTFSEEAYREATRKAASGGPDSVFTGASAASTS